MSNADSTASEITGSVIQVGVPTDDRLELTLNTPAGKRIVPLTGYVALGASQILLEGDEVRLEVTGADGDDSVTVTRVENLTTDESVSVADAKRAVAP